MGMFREDLAVHAREWTDYVMKTFPNEIAYSIASARAYINGVDCDDIQRDNNNHLGFTVIDVNSPKYDYKFKSVISENRFTVHNSKLILVNTDSVSAVFDFYNLSHKIAVLNFASFTHPGGKFYEGSRAQEEALCHESTLYPVLRAHPEYYEHNKDYKNNFMYDDRLLYTKDIIFIKDRIVKADVITCAAPNMNANSKYGRVKVNSDSLYFTLLSRAMFIIKTALNNEADTMILGAWGCGVFMCPPDLVCQAFIEAIKCVRGAKDMNFIFAVPRDKKNYPVFKEIFEHYGGKR